MKTLTLITLLFLACMHGKGMGFPHLIGLPYACESPGTASEERPFIKKRPARQLSTLHIDSCSVEGSSANKSDISSKHSSKTTYCYGKGQFPFQPMFHLTIARLLIEKLIPVTTNKSFKALAFLQSLIPFSSPSQSEMKGGTRQREAGICS